MAPVSWRARAWSFVELTAATGFAVAQPLLSVFGRAADDFIYRQSSPRQILAFTVVVCFALPSVLWLAEQLIGLWSRRAAGGWHVVALAGCAVLYTAVLVHRLADLSPVVVWVVATAAGATFAALYLRVGPTRTWLRVASLAVPAVAALFLFSSSVTPLVLDETVTYASARAASAHSSVVLLVFDEWPTSSFVDAAGGVKADLFPNLARLARTGTWYRNATSYTNSTWHAVPTIFTGIKPTSDDIPEAYSHPNSIFTLLAPTHRMDVSETVTRVCPRTLCAVPAQDTISGTLSVLHSALDVYGAMLVGHQGNVTGGFDEGAVAKAVTAARASKAFAEHEPLDLAGGLATGNSPSRFDDFLAQIRRNEGPTLHVLHILLPHVPYHYLPNGLQYVDRYPTLGEVGDSRVDDAWPAALADERLLLQTQYVDSLVGRMLDRLTSTGLLDRSTVVVTADHGIAFDPGQPARGLGDAPIPRAGLVEDMWRPLFVKLPGQTSGGPSDANVMDIDIVPTIANALHTRIPWKVDGVPAGSRPASDTTKLFGKSTENSFGAAVGKERHVDGRAGLRTMLARNIDAVAPPVSEHDVLQPYRVGPLGDLVGRPIADFTIADDSGARADVDDPGAFDDIDARTGVVPGLLTGTLDRDATVVAVVGGRVAGTSPTFRDGDVDRRFALMVPTQLMRQGDNRLDLYVLDPTSERTLHAVRVGS